MGLMRPICRFPFVPLVPRSHPVAELNTGLYRTLTEGRRIGCAAPWRISDHTPRTRNFLVPPTATPGNRATPWKVYTSSRPATRSREPRLKQCDSDGEHDTQRRSSRLRSHAMRLPSGPGDGQPPINPPIRPLAPSPFRSSMPWLPALPRRQIGRTAE